MQLTVVVIYAVECSKGFNEYNEYMMDEQQFRRVTEAALEDLKKALILAEESAEFEVEESSGTLQVSFDGPTTKFVITPNTAVRQIWISALTSSFKLDWSGAENGFVLAKTGEALKPLVSRLINEVLPEAVIRL